MLNRSMEIIVGKDLEKICPRLDPRQLKRGWKLLENQKYAPPQGQLSRDSCSNSYALRWSSCTFLRRSINASSSCSIFSIIRSASCVCDGKISGGWRIVCNRDLEYERVFAGSWERLTNGVQSSPVFRTTAQASKCTARENEPKRV